MMTLDIYIYHFKFYKLLLGMPPQEWDLKNIPVSVSSILHEQEYHNLCKMLMKRVKRRAFTERSYSYREPSSPTNRILL
jgi:hypothetical protein